VKCTINKNVINNPDQINIDKVLEYATLIPKTNPDYHTLTAKQFYKISNPFEIKKYFQINENELNTIFGSNNLNNYTFTFTLSNSGFNFLKPTTVAFEIKVQKIGLGTKSKIIEFNDFKEDSSIIGQIDKLALNQLYTPANAISYKEKLERFEITDIKPTSENNYNDVLKRTTWDKVKWEFMYQVRFYMYQMFSDNFSEINYYIINEVNEKSFSAICEGIIKESRNNILYGPLVSFGTSGCNTTSNVKTGDKIRFQINFNINQTGFQPSLLNRSSGTNLDWGEFSNSWWWDFSDSCNNLRNPNNPLYVADNLPRISWAGKIKNWSVSINNSTTLSFSPNQWSSYSFIDKVTIPKNNK
ncbi:MAG: hypothetical protein K2K73_02510, partial [Ureaplasma sp.]|nr:hypothetical protein [Ureaplasma sp.]